MEIKQWDDGKKGGFFIGSENQKQAEMTYTWVGTSKLIIDHTEVGESLKGKGAGRKLVDEAVVFARNKSISIIPLCPFAKSVFDKTPEFRDVL